MKTLLSFVVLVVLVQTSFGQDNQPLSDERLADMASGVETLNLDFANILNANPGEILAVWVRDYDSTWLYTRHLPAGFDAMLVGSGRGIILTHPQAKEKFVLVRTRFTGEQNFKWVLLMTTKDKSADFTVFENENYDDERFENLLRSIVP